MESPEQYSGRTGRRRFRNRVIRWLSPDSERGLDTISNRYEEGSALQRTIIAREVLRALPENDFLQEFAVKISREYRVHRLFELFDIDPGFKDPSDREKIVEFNREYLLSDNVPNRLKSHISIALTELVKEDLIADDLNLQERIVSLASEYLLAYPLNENSDDFHYFTVEFMRSIFHHLHRHNQELVVNALRSILTQIDPERGASTIDTLLSLIYLKARHPIDPDAPPNPYMELLHFAHERGLPLTELQLKKIESNDEK